MFRRRAYLGLVATGAVGGIAGVAPGTGHATRSARVTQLTGQAKLAAADQDVEDAFGGTVALASDGKTALLGAPEDEDPNGFGAGSAYVFGPGDMTTTTPTPTNTPTETPTATPAGTPTDTAGGGASAPGFGMVSALAGLGGAGYLSHRRLVDGD